MSNRILIRNNGGGDLVTITNGGNADWDASDTIYLHISE